MSSSKLKTLRLYDIFKEYTDSEHRVTADRLCSLLKTEYGIIAERKSIYRDIDALIEYGADIQKTPTGYYLGAREMQPAEIRLLVSAVQSASFITEAKTRQLIRKLTGDSSKYQKSELLKQKNLGSIKYSNEEIYSNIDAINKAISLRRKISFYYYKKDLRKRDEVQHNGLSYLASPYAMIWDRDRYYLVCNLEGHDDLTHFRLDRIRHIYCESIPWRHFREVSEYKTTFDASDYALNCINMFGGEVVEVELLCKRERINEIVDRFGTKVPVQRVDEDHFRTIVNVAMSNGFLAWVAQYFDTIEIVRPASARDKIKSMLRSALEQYE